MVSSDNEAEYADGDAAPGNNKDSGEFVLVAPPSRLKLVMVDKVVTVRPPTAMLVQPASWDQEMNARMIGQVVPPQLVLSLPKWY